MPVHDYIVRYELHINGNITHDHMTVAAYDPDEAIALVRAIISHRIQRAIWNPTAERKEIFLDE